MKVKSPHLRAYIATVFELRCLLCENDRLRNTASGVCWLKEWIVVWCESISVDACSASDEVLDHLAWSGKTENRAQTLSTWRCESLRGEVCWIACESMLWCKGWSKRDLASWGEWGTVVKGVFSWSIWQDLWESWNVFECLLVCWIWCWVMSRNIKLNKEEDELKRSWWWWSRRLWKTAWKLTILGTYIYRRRGELSKLTNGALIIKSEIDCQDMPVDLLESWGCSVPLATPYNSPIVRNFGQAWETLCDWATVPGYDEFGKCRGCE